jgi:hypothetical protein
MNEVQACGDSHVMNSKQLESQDSTARALPYTLSMIAVWTVGIVIVLTVFETIAVLPGSMFIGTNRNGEAVPLDPAGVNCIHFGVNCI